MPARCPSGRGVPVYQPYLERRSQDSGQGANCRAAVAFSVAERLAIRSLPRVLSRFPSFSLRFPLALTNRNAYKARLAIPQTHCSQYRENRCSRDLLPRSRLRGSEARSFRFIRNRSLTSLRRTADSPERRLDCIRFVFTYLRLGNCRDYSYLRATTGSTLAARRAGR